MHISTKILIGIAMLVVFCMSVIARGLLKK